MDSIKKQIESYKPFDEIEARDKAYFLAIMERYKNEDIFSRQNDLVHFTASAFTVNEGLDKMLNVYHNIFGGFVYPGGHADGDRNLLGVSIKETEEEAFDKEDLKSGQYFKTRPISEDIFSIQSFAIKGHMKKGVYIPAHIHLDIMYLLLVDERRKLKVKPDENSAVKFSPLNEIIDNSGKDIVDYFNPVIQRNINKLKLTIPTL